MIIHLAFFLIGFIAGFLIGCLWFINWACGSLTWPCPCPEEEETL